MYTRVAGKATGILSYGPGNGPPYRVPEGMAAEIVDSLFVLVPVILMHSWLIICNPSKSTGFSWI
jgi:hypothetical protein